MTGKWPQALGPTSVRPVLPRVEVVMSHSGCKYQVLHPQLGPHRGGPGDPGGRQGWMGKGTPSSPVAPSSSPPLSRYPEFCTPTAVVSSAELLLSHLLGWGAPSQAPSPEEGALGLASLCTDCTPALWRPPLAPEPSLPPCDHELPFSSFCHRLNLDPYLVTQC